MLFIKCRHLYSENIHFAFISSNAAYDIFQVNSGRQSNVECLLVYSFTHLIQIFFRAFRGQESRYLIEYWALPWHLLYHTWHLMQGGKKGSLSAYHPVVFFSALIPGQDLLHWISADKDASIWILYVRYDQITSWSVVFKVRCTTWLEAR